jgi:hypothetical protein
VRTSCDVEVFATEIGFGSARKRKPLEDALALIREHGNQERVYYWQQKYQKVGFRWQPILQMS